MATRVFLLSADEKAVHVITQILDEQDIRFEHSSDPTFTLKRLAGQHFDVLVVDCANAESAMQVFNSARASSLNKGAIAIAIVEGKAGVPNAFRLGASLVLTKPVSLDQARNTLRTAVGMTRKDAVEARPMTVPSAPPPVPAPVHAAVPAVAPIVSATPVIVNTPPVVVAPPTPIAPLPSAPVIVPVAPVIAPTTAPVVAAPQVVAARIPEVPAPTKTPLPSVQTPPPSTAAASKETVITEKVTLTPVAAKPNPPLQLDETRVVKLNEEVRPPVLSEKPSFVMPEKSPLSLSSAMLGSAVSDAAIDKLETELATEPQEPKTAKTFEMFAPVSKPADDSATSTDEDEVEDSAATLRASAVPAFGGLAKQPFAGIETEQRGKGLFIGGLVAVVAVGGFAAAWFYVPSFQKTLTWEYAHIHDRIANSQTKPVAPAVQSHTAPAPQPVAQVPATASEPPASPASMDPQTGLSAVAPSTVVATTTAPAAKSTAAPTASVPAPAVSAQSANGAAAKNQPSASAPLSTPSTATGNASLVNASATNVPASASPKAADLFEVPEDYADDQVIHRVHPIYPKGARAKKLQGTVVLQAIIDKQGKVDSLQMVSGDPLLAQAAADAVKQWRYKPYSHNGDPVEFQTRITVDFKLP